MNTKLLQKLAIIAAIIAAIVAFRLLNLGDFLSLAYIKESQARFIALYLDNRILTIGVYMGIYILVTALSLPGAVVMTLAGGALFGLVTGTIVISFASSIGATIACVVSRFLLRDWVQNKFGDRLAAINEGIAKEGGFYLFSLRLVPIFPFFLINLLMGLTPMRISTYYLVSQIGMLPGTIVFVNAGRQLAKIESASDILSPALLLSFAVLGLFPIIAKKTLAWYTARKSGRSSKFSDLNDQS